MGSMHWDIKPITQAWHTACRVPGDKSISHRALLCALLAEGTTRIHGWLHSQDTWATRTVCQSLGASIVEQGAVISVQGLGLGPWPVGDHDLHAHNSGTTLRLLMGLLAGRSGSQHTLFGDASLSRRPMERVAQALKPLGAQIATTQGHAPVHVRGAELTAAPVTVPLPSAQIKSAVFFAALQARGTTLIQGHLNSRDHTERLLIHLGAHIRPSFEGWVVQGQQPFSGGTLAIPGDPSHAAFLAVLTALVPGASITFTDLLLNPHRLGFARALRQMGADISWTPQSWRCGEPWGTLHVQGGARLRACVLSAEEVPSVLDELPILALAFAMAEGTSVITGAQELRVKESDRLASTVRLVRNLGGQAAASPTGFWVQGGATLRGDAVLDAGGDHRLALASVCGALLAQHPCRITGVESIGISWPSFLDDVSPWLHPLCLIHHEDVRV